MKNIFKISRIILFSLILSIFFTTCTKEEVLKPVIEVENNIGLIINKRQKLEKLDDINILEKKIIDSVEYGSKSFDSYEIKIEGIKASELEVGTVIIVDNKPLFVTENSNTLLKGTNSSLLRKSTNSNFLIKAKEVTLDFLFNYESAVVEFTTDNTRSKKNFSDGMQGTTIQPISIEVSPISDSTFSKDENGVTFKFIDSKFGLKAESNDATGKVGVSLKGSISVNPGMDFFMEYNPKFIPFNKNSEFDNYITTFLGLNDPINSITSTGLTLGTMKQMKGVFYCDLDFATDFSVELEGEFENELFKKKLSTIRKVFAVGPIPVSSVTEISLEFKAKTAGTLSYNYQKRDENDFVAAFNYTNPTNQPAKVTWAHNKDSRTTTSSYLEAKIEISAELALVIKTELYVLSTLGPKFEPKAYTESKLSYTASSNFPISYWETSMDVGLKADASLDLSLFHWDKATWSFFKKDNIFTLKKNIYNAPDRVNIISGDNQEGVINNILNQNIQVEVLDNFKKKVLLPTPVFFDGATRINFDGTPKEAYVIYNPNKGYAENKWTLGSKEGEQKMLAYLKQSNGSILGVTDTIQAIAKKQVNKIYNGDITLTTQQEVDKFAKNNYDTLNGNLTIGYPFESQNLSNINSLELFSTLKNVGGELNIHNNPDLKSLKGLNNLKTIEGRLDLFNNGLLEIDDLSSLTYVGGQIDFNENSTLSNLNGLRGIQSINGLLQLYSNGLTNLDGLENLVELKGSLDIQNNTKLNDFCGIKKLLKNGFSDKYTVEDNAFNPSKQDIIDGNCSQ